MLNWLGSRDDVATLLAKRQFGKAVKLLERQLRDDPDSVFLRQQLADALEKKGDKDRAVEILFDLVDELGEQGFVAKALALLKKIQRIDPSSDVHDRLARMIAAPDPDDDPQPGRVQAPVDTRASSDSVPILTSEVVLADYWLEDVEERDDFHWSPLFSGLSSTDVAELFSEIRLLVKKPGSIIFTEGETGDRLYVLATGAVRVYRRDRTGRNHQMSVLRAGEFFGTGGVLDGGDRQFTITAAKECELLEIDRASFDRIASKHPNVRKQVEKIAQEQTSV
ncbi:MAG: cyclic nucleotide-binding domain-containing protein [Acidobacteriota bacterium]